MPDTAPNSSISASTGKGSEETENSEARDSVTTRVSLDTWGRLFSSYFRSGWGFLIPYLLIYLVYAWLRWPANTSSAWVPSLLHVYWFLHALHVFLGVVALISWWRNSKVNQEASLSECRKKSPGFDRLWAIFPWILLGLIFWIPKIYLEWPSDPWEHLRRINEWHALDSVTAHSSWKKSSYFLPYSLTGHPASLTQLEWLNLYYTAVCLLLCWQYYRLARALALGAGVSFFFVLLQALLMGNNVFSFYRYYGLSSSIFAQLGAVALTRIACEQLRVSRDANKSAKEKTTCPVPVGNNLLFRLGTVILFLATLIAFNHVQGLGIAALGIFAVIAWRLVEWKRVMVGWLVLAAAMLSVATVWWFPDHPALDAANRTQGWMTAWYGFKLFSPTSPAFERSFQILGAFGVLNLGASLWLIRRNHLAGWLTLIPVLALITPCFALPLAHVLAIHDTIITFQRFLFAVPTGLALVTVFAHCQNIKSVEAGRSNTGSAGSSIPYPAFLRLTPNIGRNLLALLLPISLLFLLTVPPGRLSFNRFWQSTEITPGDLQLKHYIAAWASPNLTLAGDDSTLLVTSSLGARIREGFSPSGHRDSLRKLSTSIVANELEQQLSHLEFVIRDSHFSPAASQAHPGSREDWVIIPFSSRNPPEDGPAISLVSQDPAWLGGYKPETTFSGSTVIINNPIGAASHAFNPSLIPIDRSKRYRLSATLQQSGSPAAINYLAVAWYDRDGNLLESNQPAPHGGGTPFGWSNGTYSYYGLVGLPAPAIWSRYAISFGQGEMASIPDNAAFLRAGALLNYRATPGAKIQLTQVLLQEKAGYARALLMLARPTELYSPYSTAALLSGHWPPQQVPENQTGLTELRAALSAHAH